MRAGQATTDAPRQQAHFILRYSLQSFGIILLLAILIRTFLFSSFVMSGSAMTPTILPGDFLLASKVRVKELSRGAVVALRCPFAKEKLCLKRVIGLPGDRIEFHGEDLVINGLIARYQPAGAYQFEMVEGVSWQIWLGRESRAGVGSKFTAPSTSAPLGAIIVPPQNVYLLNDKRMDLDDSRAWGPVSEDLIEGKIERIWMSLDWYERERVRTWPQIRWKRLMHSID